MYLRQRTSDIARKIRGAVEGIISERGNAPLHFLDRYAGIPALALLSLFRRKRRCPREIKSIGLLKTVAIGDTVLLSGIVADLRAAFPDASIIFFCGESNLEVARMLGGVDRVIPVPAKEPFASMRAVRSVHLDILLDFGHWPRWDALLALISRADFTAGFGTPGQHRSCGYDLAIRHSNKLHAIENYRSLLRVLGIKAKHPPTLSAPHVLEPGLKPYAVFHLWPAGIRREAKQWPVEYWLQLAKQFVNWGLDVVLTGSEKDRRDSGAFLAQIPYPARAQLRSAVGATLTETATVLANSRIVVSVDTGIMHMASALGAPLVALHGPTSARRWGPLGDRAIAVESPLNGCGYIQLGWESTAGRPACMESICYCAVRDACLSLLNAEPGAQAVHGQEESSALLNT